MRPPSFLSVAPALWRGSWVADTTPSPFCTFFWVLLPRPTSSLRVAPAPVGWVAGTRSLCCASWPGIQHRPHRSPYLYEWCYLSHSWAVSPRLIGWVGGRYEKSLLRVLVGHPAQAQSSPVDELFVSTLALLEGNLRLKSRLFNDEALAPLFLMNQAHYILSAVTRYSHCVPTTSRLLLPGTHMSALNKRAAHRYGTLQPLRWVLCAWFMRRDRSCTLPTALCALPCSEAEYCFRSLCPVPLPSRYKLLRSEEEWVRSWKAKVSGLMEAYLKSTSARVRPSGLKIQVAVGLKLLAYVSGSTFLGIPQWTLSTGRQSR